MIPRIPIDASGQVQVIGEAAKPAIEGKHTPGPWETEDEREIVGPCGQAICRVYDADDLPCLELDTEANEDAFEQEVQANATLIAAAPELLEALEMLLPYFKGEHSHDHPDVLRADRAIAKATGQTP